MVTSRIVQHQCRLFLGGAPLSSVWHRTRHVLNVSISPLAAPDRHCGRVAIRLLPPRPLLRTGRTCPMHASQLHHRRGLPSLHVDSWQLQVY